MRGVFGATVAILVAACALTADKSECVQTHHGVEICDGLDNDCNGQVDESSACPEGLVCTAGACGCAHSTCGSPPACVDTSKDASNCGVCGRVCPSVAPLCSNGWCTPQCPAPTRSSKTFCFVPAAQTFVVP